MKTPHAFDIFASIQDELMSRLLAGVADSKLAEMRQAHVRALMVEGFKHSEAIHAFEDSVETARYMREQEEAA